MVQHILFLEVVSLVFSMFALDCQLSVAIYKPGKQSGRERTPSPDPHMSKSYHPSRANYDLVPSFNPGNLFPSPALPYQFLYYSLWYLSPSTLYSNYLCMCLITFNRLYWLDLLRKVKIRNSPYKVYFCIYYVSILEAIIHCIYSTFSI